MTIYTSTSHPLNSFVRTEKTNNINTIIDKLLFIVSDYSNVNMNILPKNFDPQNNVWKNLLTNSENQGNCGSCWSFASSSCLSDRINILSQKKILQAQLSPLVSVLCNDLSSIFLSNDEKEYETINNPFKLNEKIDNGCYGDSIISAFYYMKFFGISKENCFPYKYKTDFLNFKLNATNFGIDSMRQNIDYLNDYKNFSIQKNNANSCYFYNAFTKRPFEYCSDTIIDMNGKNYGTPSQNFYALLIYSVLNGKENNDFIKYEIFRWGPICSSFIVYEDYYIFDPIKDGVYIHDEKYDNILGGHSIEIVGWGEWKNDKQEIIPFWWIKNSWGTKYGYNGYFRFLRGKNHCEIENNIVCAIPSYFFYLNDLELLKKYNEKFEKLNIFKTNPKKKLSDYIEILKKVLYSIVPFPKLYKEQMIEKSLNIYGIFSFDALINCGYLNPSFLITNGYSNKNFINMPGVNYKKNFNENLNFLQNNFFAGNIDTNSIITTFNTKLYLWFIISLLIILIILKCFNFI